MPDLPERKVLAGLRLYRSFVIAINHTILSDDQEIGK
jgi:hypothetical protein